jgi:hypothetical protein
MPRAEHILGHDLIVTRVGHEYAATGRSFPHDPSVTPEWWILRRPPTRAA